MCTKRDSKKCKAYLKIELSTGKMIGSESDFTTHSHLGELEPYLILNVNGVRMEGAAGDNIL